MQERLAKLAGGVAVIRVGAPTETELKEKKDRTDDALNATRAAIEEGFVAGGGVALLRASKALDNLNLEGDEELGVGIVKKAAAMPLIQIADNAGLNGALIAAKLEEEDKENVGLKRGNWTNRRFN